MSSSAAPEDRAGAAALDPADMTADEIVTVCLARNIHDGDLIIQGVGTWLGMAAVLLARMTHAPNLVWFCMGPIDPAGESLTDVLSQLVPTTTHGRYVAFTSSLDDVWYPVMQGRMDLHIVMPAQVDMHGNLNNDVIGSDYQRPNVRLAGPGGLGDTAAYAKRTMVYLPQHTTRVLVPHVDFVTARGRVPGGHQARQQLGMIGIGPDKVVSNLGVMGFDDMTGRMRLESVHPGVSVDQVRANTGFDLRIPAEVPVTAPPATDELALLRETIDPTGLRADRFGGRRWPERFQI